MAFSGASASGRRLVRMNSSTRLLLTCTFVGSISWPSFNAASDSALRPCDR